MTVKGICLALVLSLSCVSLSLAAEGHVPLDVSWMVEAPHDLMSPVDAVDIWTNGLQTEMSGGSCPPPRTATTNDFLCFPEEHGQSTPTCDDCNPGVMNVCCSCICYCLN